MSNLLIGLLISSAIIVNSFKLEDLPKCCNRDSFIEKTSNSKYKCSLNKDMRMQIYSPQTNNLNTSEKCIELFESSVNIFEMRDENIFLSTPNPQNVKLTPKCCPLGFAYSPTTHACKKTLQEFEDPFINLVKVGLPHCEIIADNVFASHQEGSRFIANRHEDYCLDRTENGEFIARICTHSGICNQIRCIRKCCPDGQSYVNKSQCISTHIHGLDLHFENLIKNPKDEFVIIHGHKPARVYKLKNFTHPLQLLDEKGIFHVEKSIDQSVNHYGIDEEKYCIEHVTLNKTEQHFFFKIVPQVQTQLTNKLWIIRWAQITTCVFLVITIFVYILTDEIASIFGKILVSFCVAWLCAFILLITTTFVLGTSRIICKFIGFGLIYSVHSSFVWMNIMCIDIYWKFGSPKSVSAIKQKGTKKFLLYSLYGWGLPALLTLFSLTVYFTNILPPEISISVGELSCYIKKGNYAELVFVSMPLTILEIINLILFIKTIRYYLKVKKEIHNMNDNQKSSSKNKFNANRERLSLIFKLSIVMGITFIFEVLSSFYNFSRNDFTKYIEIVWDFFNCLIGIFIFLIFVCKKKIFNKCKRNVGLRKFSLTSGATQTTRVS